MLVGVAFGVQQRVAALVAATRRRDQSADASAHSTRSRPPRSSALLGVSALIRYLDGSVFWQPTGYAQMTIFSNSDAVSSYPGFLNDRPPWNYRSTEPHPRTCRRTRSRGTIVC